MLAVLVLLGAPRQAAAAGDGGGRGCANVMWLIVGGLLRLQAHRNALRHDEAQAATGSPVDLPRRRSGAQLTTASRTP